MGSFIWFYFGCNKWGISGWWRRRRIHTILCSLARYNNINIIRMALSCFGSKLAVFPLFPFWMIMCLLCSMHNTVPFPHIFSVLLGNLSAFVLLKLTICAQNSNSNSNRLEPVWQVKDLVYLKAVKYFFLLLSSKRKVERKKAKGVSIDCAYSCLVLCV